ncbi:MAG: SprT-like domain-containing protein [Vicinamibacterales bacterium]
MITFACARCRGGVHAADGRAGRPVACPRCGQLTVCPQASMDTSGGQAGRPDTAPGPVAATTALRTPRGRSSGLTLFVAGALILGSAGWASWRAFDTSGMRSSVRPAASPAEARQRELLEANIDAAGDASLTSRFAEINARHFAGRLPATPVIWESRLDEVGALAQHAFTLEGMFGHVGSKSVVLLNPNLRSDPRALDRALCHEMVHAYLHAIGDETTDHGAAFQAELRRLSAEGAFEGIVATDAERAQLRAWLDQEAARLDAEHEAMAREGEAIQREQQELERDVADLNARVAAANSQGAAPPTAAEIEALNARRDAYNRRAEEANARLARDREAVAGFNRQVDRYNLMLSYPDGVDEDELVQPRAGAGATRR